MNYNTDFIKMTADLETSSQNLRSIEERLKNVSTKLIFKLWRNRKIYLELLDNDLRMYVDIKI